MEMVERIEDAVQSSESNLRQHLMMEADQKARKRRPPLAQPGHSTESKRLETSLCRIQF